MADRLSLDAVAGGLRVCAVGAYDRYSCDRRNTASKRLRQ